MLSEEEQVQEFVEALEQEVLEKLPEFDDGYWDWIPERLRPDTMMGLAMTQHFMRTPVRERV